MITLRFENPFTPHVMPLVLRFEFVPQIGFDWGAIGHSIDLAYTNLPDNLETLIDLANFSVATEQVISFDYLATVHDNEIGIYWAIKPLVTHYVDLSYKIGPNVQGQISIDWGITPLTTQHIRTDWYGLLPKSDQTLLTPWTSNKTKVETECKFVWADLVIAEQDFIEYWHSVIDRVDVDINVAWGIRLPRWVCSTNHRPAKGKVSIDFTTNHSPQYRNVTIRFTASPEYCYWDDGSGPIDSNPDLPNFDFTVPIEPQIERVYLMQPQLTVIRVSDGTPIGVTSVSISDTRGQFSASVRVDFSSKGDYDLAMNQLLLVSMNGYQFYAVPEQGGYQRAFNSIQYTAQGRSRTALISSPWVGPVNYSNSVDRTLAGVMTDLLVGTSWSVQLVGFTDFNIPAGVFSITGKSPVDSVNDVADQIGCILIPDEFNSVLKVYPRWPVTPWNFATEIPAVAIHEHVIITYNESDEINPLCNAAWVRGEQQGVSRKVRRTGTAGDVPTADIAGPLILTDIPARLVGTAAIADTGNKKRIVVSLPVMATLPPLVKGMLIGVSYFGDIYKATCDGTAITATVDNSGGIDITQSVTLIRHME